MLGSDVIDCFVRVPDVIDCFVLVPDVIDPVLCWCAICYLWTERVLLMEQTDDGSLY